MKKSDSQSLQKTLAFAATVAALGASVGVPVEQALAAPQNQTSGSGPLLLAFTLVEETGAKKGAQSSAAKSGAVQQKADRGQGAQRWGTRQGKENKAKAGAPGSTNMLNPQPLPPKQGLGINSAGQQSPAIQK